MNISTVNAATPVYSASASNAKAAMTYQAMSDTPMASQTDTVNVSQTAQNMSKVASFGYDLPYDERGFELFQRWQNSSELFMMDKEKPIDQLLPESQHLIEHFQEKMRSAKSVDEREQFSAKISYIMYCFFSIF